MEKEIQRLEKFEGRVEKKVKKEVRKNIDKLFYIGAVVSPITSSPQLIKIFYFQDATGVSLFTWASFFCGSLFLLTYGLVHKQKPIVYLNATILPIYIGIIIGILLYS